MLRLAVVQFAPVLLRPEESLRAILGWMEQAARQGCELAVFPECSLTGYALTGEEADVVAEPIPGARTAALTDACRQHGMHVVLGMLERDPDGLCYNSSALLSPDGIVAVYRKTHLPLLGVDRFLASGDELPGPFQTAIGPIGMLVCYDLRFPEPIRILALAGAHLVALPTNWPESATLYPQYLARTRAAENGIFLAAANRVGEERGTRFLGHSLIAGPDGQMLAEADGSQETLLIAEIQMERAAEKRRVFRPGEYELDLFGDRRPELYRRLVEPGRTDA
jgi:predicted amidohydrolase